MPLITTRFFRSHSNQWAWWKVTVIQQWFITGPCLCFRTRKSTCGIDSIQWPKAAAQEDVSTLIYLCPYKACRTEPPMLFKVLTAFWERYFHLFTVMWDNTVVSDNLPALRYCSFKFEHRVICQSLSTTSYDSHKSIKDSIKWNSDSASSNASAIYSPAFIYLYMWWKVKEHDET